MRRPITLVVDDEPAIRELLEITLARMDIDCRSAGTVNEARALLEQDRFDLCLTDMKLPDGDGLDLVSHIQERMPSLPVAVITAHGSMDSAVRALKMGAFDFVSKPIDLAMLRKLVDSALRLGTYPLKDRRSRQQLLGDSAVMREIRSKIMKVARSQAPIYISGESGTGKELVARLIHEKSSRHDKPFVAINCGAIPAELMESEFFGHLKGSFTGAVSDKPGLFRAADGGTLFLDEIADLPQSLQVKLLRAIQEKQVRPVGSQEEIPVDIRILSATHKNLTELVDQGVFRQDLYYRINVIELSVPPLRERIGDIATLSEHILNKLSGQTGLPVTELSPDALSALQAYNFPGNVRELENILERSMALCENNRISAADLGLPDVPALKVSVPEQTAKPVSLENYMDEIEKQAIIQALEQTHWNRTAAAKKLGITFRALRYRLKKLGLE
ncbi:MAG: sigma-54 dependent transcriptional regulator [Methylococcaceae bacterium]|nr:sigma-54 dependent transcriptional regulator [Methylococcaceae bacterium]MCI0733091.1 sigma-54 dependent transcriptional regulator [Methylococcaceae bacterium]